MKAIKLFGISAILFGVVVLASGCNTCGTPRCEPVNDCQPACAPVVNTCSPCGR